MEIRAIADDEVTAFRAAMLTTFGGDHTADPHGDERFRKLVGPGRGFAAYDGGTMVGTAGTFDLRLSVPGGSSIQVAGLTVVTVRPTHRRRGLLRGLMAAHFDEARARGVGVSALWASEATIYGRFGYGVAAESDDLQVTTQGLEVAGESFDELEPLDDQAPLATLAPIYEAAWAARPGMMSRSADWWRLRRFMERPDITRSPSSPRRYAVARRGGAATGYMVYRHRPGWENGVAAGSMEIEELVHLDARAERTLWRLAMTIDLFPRVSYWNAPLDCLLPWLVADGRRVKRRRSDTLWLRIEDPIAALGARSYGADGALRLDIEGQPVALRVDGGAGRATAGDGPADLRLDRASLGSLYLGGFSATLLQKTGRVSGEPRALALADRMFATAAPPWCAEVF